MRRSSKLTVLFMLSLVIVGALATPAQAAWRSNSRGWWWTESSARGYATGWRKISGKWYWFDSKGYMATGWKKIDGKWYFFNPGGDMATGWKKVGSAWYYLNPGGDMVTGWKKVGSVWYYLNPGGDMATGWKKVGTYWYYLNADGSMKTGWLKSGSNWYYLWGKSDDRWLDETAPEPPRGSMMCDYSIIYKTGPDDRSVEVSIDYLISRGVNNYEADFAPGFSYNVPEMYRFDESGAMVTGYVDFKYAWSKHPDATWNRFEWFDDDGRYMASGGDMVERDPDDTVVLVSVSRRK